MSDFRTRLIEAMEINNVNQAELAKRTGLSKPRISQYVNGIYEAKQDALSRLSEALGVNVAWLMGYDVPMRNDALPSGAIPVSRRKIPVLGTIACGEPVLSEEVELDLIDDYPSNADFALRASGDSMVNARIYDGDLVFIHRQPEVNNGDIAAVAVDGEATLKRFYYYNNDTIQLVAENPLYRPLIYAGTDLSRIRVLGKAIGFYSEIK